MSIADEAAAFLRNVATKGGSPLLGQAEPETAAPSTSTPAEIDMQYKVQLAQQRASRAKFDKWMKRAAAVLAGAAVAYWFFTRRKHV